MRYYWVQILKFVPAFVPIIIIEILLQHFFPSTGFAALIGQGIAYMAVFTAVSYTHLDVYKRQRVWSVICAADRSRSMIRM